MNECLVILVSHQPVLYDKLQEAPHLQQNEWDFGSSLSPYIFPLDRINANSVLHVENSRADILQISAAVSEIPFQYESGRKIESSLRSRRGDRVRS